MNPYNNASGPIGNEEYPLTVNDSAATSPSSQRTPGRARRRHKRAASTAGIHASPGDGDEGGEDRRKQPGVKRACNECRQQKLRCNVVEEDLEDPFKPCARCQRLKLECRIDDHFKRVGKRNKNAEMEREIAELKNQLAHQGASPQTHPDHIQAPPRPTNNVQNSSGMYTGLPSRQDEYIGSQEAVASLLDLRKGLDGPKTYSTAPSSRILKSLEDVVLHQDRIDDLFNWFWAYYHPFLPFLDPEKPPEHYLALSPLLFWTIITIASRRYTDDAALATGLAGPLSRLLWSTISGVTQNYHVVKALCLLCTWPLPTNSTSTDPTFMMCGIMMQTALQIGLHRPSHAQDFSRFRIDLREEDIRDRLRTWAACNIVAQNSSTAFGQPPLTVYDDTLLQYSQQDEGSDAIPDELKTRLRIEKFCDKVTRALYSHQGIPGENRDGQNFSLILKLLGRDYQELQRSFGPHASAINTVHLRAVGLHLHLYAFFERSSAENYRSALLDLYFAARAFLACTLNPETTAVSVLPYASNPIMFMILAAGFTLLKLLNSFFASSVAVDDGKALFNRTIWAVRQMSVTNNDIPQRLAEVLAQLWRGSGAGIRPPGATTAVDGSLQLKVRCRMSMSLVFDSVWRWREEIQSRGPRGNLDVAVNDPTNPDSAVESSANSVSAVDPTLGSTIGLMGAPDGGGIGAGVAGFADSNYEVFDPLNWVLDGFVDFPYSEQAVHGLEAQGLLG